MGEKKNVAWHYTLSVYIVHILWNIHTAGLFSQILILYAVEKYILGRQQGIMVTNKDRGLNPFLLMY